MPSEERVQLWIVNQYALHEAESGGTRHHSLARRLRDLGFSTTLLSGGADIPHGAREEHIRFIRFPVLAHRSNGFQRLLGMLHFSAQVFAAAVRRPHDLPRPHLILGSSPHPFGAFAALLLARRFRVPFILEVRDVWPASLVELLGVSPRNPLVIILSTLERVLYRNARLIVSPLSHAHRRVQEVTATPPPFVHIPNGVDLDRFPVTDVPTRNEFVVTYTGAHGPPNALVQLLEAAVHISNSRPDAAIRFELVGQGVQREALITFAHETGLTNISFRESVPRFDVPRLLGDADLLVLPGNRTDLYRYGFSPNKLAEYMAAARPIVSAIAAPSHPVIEAEAGINVAPGDSRELAAAILEMYDLSPLERRTLGQNGRDFAESALNYEALAATLAARLRDVLGGTA